MLPIGGFLGFVALVIWALAVFDVIATDESLVRSLPKLYWLFIVLLFPPVGAIAWFALGRPIGAGLIPGSQQGSARNNDLPPKPGPAPKGPDDSPDFLRSMGDAERLQEWEDDLKRREEELKQREEGEEPDHP